jgi:transposase-like protein
MTVKKLSDADRREILDLYRQTGETTSTLAERYGVSNSTISRFLKATLPEEEYETLIAAKRAARTPGGEETPTPVSTQPEPAMVVAESLVEEQPSPETTAEATTTSIAERRRSSASTEPETETPAKAEVQLELLDTPNAVLDSSSTRLNQDVSAEVNTIAEMLGEELLDESEDDEDIEDLDEEDDLDEVAPILRRRLPIETFVQVLPLSEANLPKTCYLVIDRTAELITRPLREFGDLGEIPSQEIQQRTLPVFDNHRVARRFSNKRDRVIKVPDSRMLQKTRSQLQAKGITRLLFDGRVYSLSPN